MLVSTYFKIICGKKLVASQFETYNIDENGKKNGPKFDNCGTPEISEKTGHYLSK